METKRKWCGVTLEPGICGLGVSRSGSDSVAVLSIKIMDDMSAVVKLPVKNTARRAPIRLTECALVGTTHRGWGGVSPR